MTNPVAIFICACMCILSIIAFVVLITNGDPANSPIRGELIVIRQYEEQTVYSSKLFIIDYIVDGEMRSIYSDKVEDLDKILTSLEKNYDILYLDRENQVEMEAKQ